MIKSEWVFCGSQLKRLKPVSSGYCFAIIQNVFRALQSLSKCWNILDLDVEGGLYFFREPERNCSSVIKPFFGFGIILDLKVATVIIEVLVALITDCSTATSRRMSFVSDWSSQYGDLRHDIGTPRMLLIDHSPMITIHFLQRCNVQ